MTSRRRQKRCKSLLTCSYDYSLVFRSAPDIGRPCETRLRHSTITPLSPEHAVSTPPTLLFWSSVPALVRIPPTPESDYWVVDEQDGSPTLRGNRGHVGMARK